MFNKININQHLCFLDAPGSSNADNDYGKVDSADELEKKAKRDLKNRKDMEQEEREKML